MILKNLADRSILVTSEVLGKHKEHKVKMSTWGFVSICVSVSSNGAAKGCVRANMAISSSFPN